MKTIGLIGGMSWESSLEYYRIINEEIKIKLGGLNSAKILMYSVNFSEVEVWMRKDRWDKILEIMIDAGQKLKGSGADFLVICTNTVHLIAKDLENALDFPVLHIAQAVGKAISNKNIRTVGILGTSYTMEKGLYNNILEDIGIKTLIPEADERNLINKIIFDELCLGILKSESKLLFQNVVKNIALKGAQGVVLACTEIPLLIKQEDIDIPVFDSTEIHAKAAAGLTLSSS